MHAEYGNIGGDSRESQHKSGRDMDGGGGRFGFRMKLIREQAGVSVRSASKVAGINRGTLGRVEDGKSIMNVPQFTRALGYYNTKLIEKGVEPYSTDEVLSSEEFRVHE